MIDIRRRGSKEGETHIVIIVMKRYNGNKTKILQ